MLAGGYLKHWSERVMSSLANVVSLLGAGVATLIAAVSLSLVGIPWAQTARAGEADTAGVNSESSIRRSEAQYVLPPVNLLREDGQTVSLAAELNDGRPVVLNFIYTSCTTICPMSSELFEQFQQELGQASRSVHLVSISIDPEQDRPARLRAYAKQFHAAKGWDHYSGTQAASVAVQSAFNAYRGDKMSHVPLTLMRASPTSPWVRLDGFARLDDLLAERKRWAVSPPALVSR